MQISLLFMCKYPERGRGGQHSPISVIEVCAALKGKIFELFWTEMGYGF